MLEPFAGKLLVKGAGIMIYQINYTYSLVKVLHDSNNANTSDYLAFTLLVSLTLFKFKPLGDVI